MGFISDALAKLTGTGSTTGPQAGGNPLLQHVLELINNPATGGLQGLVDKFHANGLGSIVSSWVGTGQNQAISPQQITQALGSHVEQIAQKTGAPASAVASQLAALLPNVIDKLTPQGSIPTGGALAQGLAMLKNTLGASAAPAAGSTSTTPPTGR
jgi:uncharacterized protein YidB (DUF937 family)